MKSLFTIEHRMPPVRRGIPPPPGTSGRRVLGKLQTKPVTYRNVCLAGRKASEPCKTGKEFLMKKWTLWAALMAVLLTASAVSAQTPTSARSPSCTFDASVPETDYGSVKNDAITVRTGKIIKVSAICDAGGSLKATFTATGSGPAALNITRVPLNTTDPLAKNQEQMFVAWTPITDGTMTLTYTNGQTTQNMVYTVSVTQPPPPPPVIPPPQDLSPYAKTTEVNTAIDTRVRNENRALWLEAGWNWFGITDKDSHGVELNLGYNVTDQSTVHLELNMNLGWSMGHTRIVNPDLEELPGARKLSHRYQATPMIGIGIPLGNVVEPYLSAGLGIKAFNQDVDITTVYPDGSMAGLDSGTFTSAIFKARGGIRFHLGRAMINLGLSPECAFAPGEPKASGYGTNKHSQRCAVATQAGAGFDF